MSEEKPNVQPLPVNVQASCAACIFMLAQNHPNNPVEKIMTCRRFPPQAAAVPTGRPGAVNIQFMFPVVAPAMWCHEFRLKPTEMAS